MLKSGEKKKVVKKKSKKKRKKRRKQRIVMRKSKELKSGELSKLFDKESKVLMFSFLLYRTRHLI